MNDFDYSMIKTILTRMNDILHVLEVNCHGSWFPTWYNCSLIESLYLCYVGKCIVYIPEVSHVDSKLGNVLVSHSEEVNSCIN